MNFIQILKKDITIILAIVLLILIFTIGVVYAKTLEVQKNNVIFLEKEIIAQNKITEPIIVQMEQSQKELKVMQTEKNEIDTNRTKDKEYYIKVNYQENTVTVYSKDKEGGYSIPEKAFICSCGEDTPTSGVYSTSDKYKWRALVGDVYGQYATRIVGSILFHSVPYEKMNDKSSLEYWEYDKLGQTASAGCVRLKVEDAKWIYDNCKKGTKVEFYASSDPGPLGKPSSQRISSNETCRGWDPTDLDEENPWMQTNEN